MPLGARGTRSRLPVRVLLVFLGTAMAARDAEAAAVPYVHPPVLLALPGPEFPQVNFDAPLPHGAGAPEGATRRGEPFVIGGRSLYLQRERAVDSEDHAERTAGSIWDCSLVRL